MLETVFELLFLVLFFVLLNHQPFDVEILGGPAALLTLLSCPFLILLHAFVVLRLDATVPLHPLFIF